MNDVKWSTRASKDGPAGTGTCTKPMRPELNPWTPEENQLHKAVFWPLHIRHAIHKVKEKMFKQNTIMFKEKAWTQLNKFSGESTTSLYTRQSNKKQLQKH